MSSNSPKAVTTPIARQRIAERVFDSLVQAILLGELQPDAELATQDALAKQFGVSPLLVRQAIHRLEELGLVRVRQGSATIVLDPEQSTDMRVLQHRVELAASDRQTMASVLEVQILGALPLLVLAERSLTDPEVEALMRLAESVREEMSPTELHEFMIEYWRLVARGTRNAYLQHQLRWWWKIAEDLRQRGGRAPALTLAGEVRRNYLDLTRALAERRGSVQVYLAMSEPVLKFLDFARRPPAEMPSKLAQPASRRRKRKRG